MLFNSKIRDGGALIDIPSLPRFPPTMEIHDVDINSDGTVVAVSLVRKRFATKFSETSESVTTEMIHGPSNTFHNETNRSWACSADFTLKEVRVYEYGKRNRHWAKSGTFHSHDLDIKLQDGDLVLLSAAWDVVVLAEYDSRATNRTIRAFW